MSNRTPRSTRLRYVSASDPNLIQDFFETLEIRVSIYDLVWNGKKWFAWFVPPDDLNIEINSIDL